DVARYRAHALDDREDGAAASHAVDGSVGRRRVAGDAADAAAVHGDGGRDEPDPSRGGSGESRRAGTRRVPGRADRRQHEHRAERTRIDVLAGGGAHRDGGAHAGAARGAGEVMKLGLATGYWSSGPPSGVEESIAEAERLGFDSIWTAEAYGSD